MSQIPQRGVQQLQVEQHHDPVEQTEVGHARQHQVQEIHQVALADKQQRQTEIAGRHQEMSQKMADFI